MLRRPALREAGVVLFFLLLAGIATRPLASDLRGQTLAGPDPMIDLYTVHWLSGHLLPPHDLFGGNVFHPDPNAVLYSDLSLGTAVLLLPLRLLASDPVLLYNLGVLGALTFAAWAFYALARALTDSLVGGLLAGTLASFGSHQLSHVYHLNLLSSGWLALLLLALHRLAERPGWWPVLLAGASFALSAQSSGYYAVAAMLLALLFAAFHWRRWRERRVLAAAAGAALLGVLLLLPYARAFMALRAREQLRRPPGMSQRMAFHPSRDLTSYGYLYRQALGADGERLFPGLIALALGGVAVARRRPHAVFYASATGLMLLVSLGPKLELAGFGWPLPYRWLFAVPPLDNMRHPYTFAAVATFTLSILAALGWTSLRAAARPWAGALVVLAAVAETLAPPPVLRPLPQGVPPAYESLLTLPPGPALELPVFVPEALLWAARHGRPVANGIGAFAPRQTLRLERMITNHWVRRTPAEVDASPPARVLAEDVPVRYVIVPSGRKPTFRTLAEAMDRSRAFVFAAEASDGDRIYELRPEKLPSPDASQAGEEAGDILGDQGEPIGHQQ